MKKFTKLAMALLLTAGVGVLATGCKNNLESNAESVLYRSAAGDVISGKKYKDSLDVAIDIKNPTDLSQSVAGGNKVIYFQGSSLDSVVLGNIVLDGGTISDTAITYSNVSGIYGAGQNYGPKSITFTKQ